MRRVTGGQGKQQGVGNNNLTGLISHSNDWKSLSIRQRCRVIAGVAAAIAERANELTELSLGDQRVDRVETITAELLPTCSALRFIGRRGPKILRTTCHGAWGRPAWLWGLRSKVRRDPRGRVLVLGTWNYPIFLPGVQAAQALAAGNTVLLKPAVGCEQVTACLVQAFYDAGVPESALCLLASDAESAIKAIENGVELVVLTGSSETGRKVLRLAAEQLTPSILELSGCDAVIVLPGADINRVVDSIVFGLNFNGGATCIGPRRIIAENSEAELVQAALLERLKEAPLVTVHPAARRTAADLLERAISAGAVDFLEGFQQDRLTDSGEMGPVVLDHVQATDEIATADLFAPVASLLRVSDISAAAEIVNRCPYRLAAAVFGPGNRAEKMAARLEVGTVCINDLIVPTADPRLPFGGRGNSGFGVTRGGDGLLAMTVPTTISRRHGKFTPHLQPRKETDAQTLLGALQLLHAGTLARRWRGFRTMVRSAMGKTPDIPNCQNQEQTAPSTEKEGNS